MVWNRKIRVFIATPSDVAELRVVVARIVERLNREISSALFITAELLSASP